jgi:hypothetical protein
MLRSAAMSSNLLPEQQIAQCHAVLRDTIGRHLASTYTPEFSATMPDRFVQLLELLREIDGHKTAD